MRSTFPPYPVPPAPPFLPVAPGPHSVLSPPTVYFEPVWEYKHVRRDLGAEPPLGEAELNALGAEGWELAAVVAAPPVVHFYFKRSRE